MMKFFKGIIAMIYSSIAMLLFGWLLRWGTIGLLSIPEWQTYLILFCLGCFIWAIFDLVGGLIMAPTILLLKDNNMFWRVMCVVGSALAVLNNCILFWTVDAPYAFTQILVSGIVMIAYILKGMQMVLNCLKPFEEE